MLRCLLGIHYRRYLTLKCSLGGVPWACNRCPHRDVQFSHSRSW